VPIQALLHTLYITTTLCASIAILGPNALGFAPDEVMAGSLCASAPWCSCACMPMPKPFTS
jgi:hypothetical protein